MKRLLLLSLFLFSLKYSQGQHGTEQLYSVNRFETYLNIPEQQVEYQLRLNGYHLKSKTGDGSERDYVFVLNSNYKSIVFFAYYVNNLPGMLMIYPPNKKSLSNFITTLKANKTYTYYGNDFYSKHDVNKKINVFPSVRNGVSQILITPDYKHR